MLPQEELDRDLIEELRRKLGESGDLTKDEVLQIRSFEKQYNLDLTKDEQTKLRALEKLHGLLSQEDLDLDELAELRRKLLTGELSEEELRRLMELMGKYGIQLSDEELQRMRETEDKYGLN